MQIISWQLCLVPRCFFTLRSQGMIASAAESVPPSDAHDRELAAPLKEMEYVWENVEVIPFFLVVAELDYTCNFCLSSEPVTFNCFLIMLVF